MGIKLTISLVIAMAFLGAAAPSGASGRRPHARTLTFVLAGQSNMIGQGFIDGETPVDPRVTVETSTGWQTATEPLPQGVPNGPYPQVPGRGVGPGIPFADDLLADGAATRVRLISCAVNGSPIAEWIPGATYFEACTRQLAAIRHLDGVLYYQGEADALSATTAAAWPTQFVRFARGIRSLAPKVPIVFAQLGPDIGSSWGPWWTTVKTGQASIHLAGVRMIKTSDLQVQADDVHLTATSERIVGGRFARAWLRLRR